MKFKFSAKIYKVGINPCVKVPFKITDKMVPSKGYIPVKGKIKGHYFEQTLCAVKNEEFRLYVNGPMLKGSGLKVGDRATFEIEQNLEPEKRKNILMPKAFKKKLEENGLMKDFNALTPYRRKEIVKYLNNLKSEEARKQTLLVLEQMKQNVGKLKPIVEASDLDMKELEARDKEMEQIVHKFKKHLMIEKIKFED